jgi:hypothetical protein
MVRSGGGSGGTLLLLLVVAGCSATGSDPGGQCTYAGSVHASGATFPAGDGCNTCSCDAHSTVICTRSVCLDGGGAGAGGAAGGPGGGAGISGAGGGAGASGIAIDGGPFRCSFDATYTVGSVGGLSAWTDVATLGYPSTLTLTRTWVTDAAPVSRSCSPALPPCEPGIRPSVNDIIYDLEDPDVQAGFAAPAPALFGMDSRPADGTVYQIARSTGGTIQVGADCPTSGAASCRPIPAGVARLAADLKKLIENATTGGVCENVTRPFPL